MNSLKSKRISDKRNVVCTAVGKSLKTFRLITKTSQERLAFDAEVDRTYVSQIERGLANPSIVTLANLCFALDITLSDLFSNVQLALAPDGVQRRTVQPTSVKKSRS